MNKLKDLRVILVIVLVISWIAAGFLFYYFKTTSDAQLSNKDVEIAELQNSLTQIGELVPAYIVNADVPSGKKVEEADLQLIEVPLSMSTNLINDIEMLVGKHYKVGLTAGTVITTDSIYEEVITADMRYYDVLIDVVPIGLKPGSFVDVRIKYGTGADFIGISHRQVASVNQNVVKLIVTEKDIHMFSSMLVDNIVFNEKFRVDKDVNNDGKVDDKDTIPPIGCYIYAIEYVDGGVQDKAADYFAPSMLVQAIMQGDPNMLIREDYSPNDLVLKRQLIDAGLTGNDNATETAKKIRDVVQDMVEEGRKAYEKALEIELKNAQGK